jgi:hypothetical protein
LRQAAWDCVAPCVGLCGAEWRSVGRRGVAWCCVGLRGAAWDCVGLCGDACGCVRLRVRKFCTGAMI